MCCLWLWSASQPASLLLQSLVFHGTHCCFLLLVLPGAAGKAAPLLWPG